MIQQSAFDLHFLVKELKELEGARVDQIYQYSPKEFVFRFHKGGKKELAIIVPNGLFLTKNRPKATTSNLPSFCVYCRKYLKGLFVRSVSQLGFDRLIQFELNIKDKTYLLLIELFDKGNIIICDSEYKILSVAQVQKWSERIIMRGQTYAFDNPALPSTALFEPEDVISKALATKSRLGGKASKIICEQLNIDPLAIVKDISLSKVDAKLTELLQLEKNPLVPENFYDENMSIKVEKSEVDIKAAKIDVILKSQKKSQEKFEKGIDENKDIGEYIYENFTELENILKEVQIKRKALDKKDFAAYLKEKGILHNEQNHTITLTR